VLFKLFDINGDKFISKIELMTVMKSISGENSNEEEIEAMFDEADADGSGEIDYDEFREVMMKNK
jgi:calmodulin